MRLPDVPQWPLPDWCHPEPEQLITLIPPSMDLQLAVLSFDEQGFQPDDFARCQIEPPVALQRAARKRQAEFLAGRLCAGEALRQHCGISQYPGKDGDGAPVWPGRISGSISHSAGIAMAIVGARNQHPGMGLDVEVIQNHTEARALSSLVLTPGEASRFRQMLTGNPGLCLTRIFSLKEALFKALYPLTRQRFYFQDAEVTTMDADGHCRLRLLTALSDTWPRGAVAGARLSHWRDRVVALVTPFEDQARSSAG